MKGQLVDAGTAGSFKQGEEIRHHEAERLHCSPADLGWRKRFVLREFIEVEPASSPQLQRLIDEGEDLVGFAFTPVTTTATNQEFREA